MGAVEKPKGRALATDGWEYAPSLESREIVSFQERYGLFIGGEEVTPRSRSWFPTISPWTEEPLAEVAQAGAKDVALAVNAAREGFEKWSALEARPSAAKVLFRIARVSRSVRASSRWRNHWTAASQSRSRVTSTSRSLPRIFSTTPAGRTSSSTHSRGVDLGRSAWQRRSFPGTSRC